MKLTTERLELRPLKESDLPQMQRYATRPKFYRYNPIEEQTPESVAVFLQKELEKQRHDGRHVLALEPKEVGFIVGTVRIEVRDQNHRHGDLGYALDSEYQGRGYMTEAVQRLIRFGFEELQLHRIWATCNIDNAPSWRLMERAGMTREGLLRDDKFLRGHWRSSYLYAILASDKEL
ncbi:GNAT family N-acetyltransferase [Pelagibius sp. Alg239-R121]|uniref:GNAT family N-acetyltransferase n=1 Tax=Pelagibius sp. Alg239-R121 TaxID=2993448 RepID=UPI0024A672EF|nr:GNAT family protein [Pelagibius sp. Alg239-R121]